MRYLILTLALVLVRAAIAAPTGLLNDTGQTACYDAGGNVVACSGAADDGRYGRDAAQAKGVLYKSGAGAAAFDYTKVANNGNDLAAGVALGGNAGDWACTRDNVTGLVWEVKTDDGGLRDQENTYTNYDDPTQAQRWNGSAYVNPTQPEIDAATNSIGYVNAVNALAGANRLCGASDWRRPSKKELLSIVHHGRVSPAIDTDYFPNTPSWDFWSGSPYAGDSNFALYVYFSSGVASYDVRGEVRRVRLVRGGA